MIVFLVGSLGYTASFIIWSLVVYSIKKRGEAVPELMYVFTSGALLFSLLSIVLLIDYDGMVRLAQWFFALGGIGLLLVTIKKVGK